LTTVVSLDPMYAYFDMDEPTLLRIRHAIIDGRINQPEDGVIPVQMGLQGEDGFPHEGTINFLNNQVNSGTGSITLRGVFNNPRLFGDAPSVAAMTVAFLGAPAGQGPLLALPGPMAGAGRRGTRLLSPGMFVRIRLPIGTPHRAVLIIDRAIQSDQGLKYVYVVDAENKVQYRRITTAALEKNGLRVVMGLEPSDLVVVGALQQAKPKMTVKPEEHPMPVLNSQAGADVQDKGGPGDKAAKK